MKNSPKIVWVHIEEEEASDYSDEPSVFPSASVNPSRLYRRRIRLPTFTPPRSGTSTPTRGTFSGTHTPLRSLLSHRSKAATPSAPSPAAPPTPAAIRTRLGQVIAAQRQPTRRELSHRLAAEHLALLRRAQENGIGLEDEAALTASAMAETESSTEERSDLVLLVNEKGQAIGLVEIGSDLDESEESEESSSDDE